MEARELGRFGEERAAHYLRLHGYRIVETNYACRLGEIDLIARKGRYLVFVEVKLRKSGDFAAAREFVTRGKQQRILSTAAVYLAQNETELQPRFDVLEIYAPPLPLFKTCFSAAAARTKGGAIGLALCLGFFTADMDRLGAAAAIDGVVLAARHVASDTGQNLMLVFGHFSYLLSSKRRHYCLKTET